ncbi:MAG: HAD hydrolase-like protein [Candidatus Aenigmarchaeota archaeon]|nr:HAD hydrolase-like protein [Candidatus Aenigmarchaeota archaeon]MCK5062445.1 HAD hydrolase-like protein [Candidatus Aenigmarchaeota archaeon]
MFKVFADNYIPDYKIESFDNISDNFLNTLKDKGIEAIFLDVDGTITTHYGKAITEDAKQFLVAAKKVFKLAYITNCGFDRSKIVSHNLGEFVDKNVFWPGYFKNDILYFISKKINRKPFRQAYLNAAEELGIPIEKCAIIGDQYSTDIWGAKKAGIGYTIKIDNNLSSNEPGKKKWQRKFENEVYRNLLKYTDKRPENIKDMNFS